MCGWRSWQHFLPLLLLYTFTHDHGSPRLSWETPRIFQLTVNKGEHWRNIFISVTAHDHRTFMWYTCAPSAAWLCLGNLSRKIFWREEKSRVFYLETCQLLLTSESSCSGSFRNVWELPQSTNQPSGGSQWGLHSCRVFCPPALKTSCPEFHIQDRNHILGTQGEPRGELCSPTLWSAAPDDKIHFFGRFLRRRYSRFPVLPKDVKVYTIRLIV